MSSPGITEFAYASVKAEYEADYLNPETVAGKAIELMINEVLKAPGARHAHWGPSLEDPKQIRIFIDWDKVQDHLDYRESEYVLPPAPSMPRVWKVWTMGQKLTMIWV